ncbi:2-nitropropane dioxygenase [Favolaschia claudopus]|uniref:2-nitropropane dioxygenase n=1 Tax=Favolaschia claudopus TaxID=2862362 RepID=A0AAW0CUC4_9AGAR
MQTIDTPLTKRLGIKTPIVSAPMAFASTPELAAGVTGAGGFGCIGAGFDSSKLLTSKIQKVRTLLNTAPGQPVPLAIGFIGWILEMTESSDDPRLEVVLEEVPAAVWFAFGLDLWKYVDRVHTHDRKTGRKTFIFVMVHSVDDARQAKEKGVDAVVVQGIEAGGHGRGDSPPLLTLLDAVLSERQKWTGGGPLVLAAGGITTGADIANLLEIGADGVVLGTRFLFTHECEYSAAQKDAILKAGPDSTVRTLAFDDVGRTNGWPPNYDGRAISNEVMSDLDAGLSLDERRRRFDESARNGDDSRLVVWAGVGVALVNEISSAADVLRSLHQDTMDDL